MNKLSKMLAASFLYGVIAVPAFSSQCALVSLPGMPVSQKLHSEVVVRLMNLKGDRFDMSKRVDKLLLGLDTDPKRETALRIAICELVKPLPSRSAEWDEVLVAEMEDALKRVGSRMTAAVADRKCPEGLEVVEVNETSIACRGRGEDRGYVRYYYMEDKNED